MKTRPEADVAAEPGMHGAEAWVYAAETGVYTAAKTGRHATVNAAAHTSAALNTGRPTAEAAASSTAALGPRGPRG